MNYSVSMIRVSGRATQYWQTLGPTARVYHILRCYAGDSRHMKIEFKSVAERVPRNARALAFAVALCAAGIGAIAIHSAAQGTAPHAAAGARADIDRFRARVAAVLGQPNAGKLNWGIEIVDRTTGQPLYELNADHFFTPASNAKVVTTALAFATLGSDFRFRTTLESAAAPDAAGRLAGDLVLVGRGDPDLSNRRFPFTGHAERSGPVEKILAELVDQAVAKGLREVDGDVVADDSFYPYDPYPAGWSSGDLFFTFGAPVSAVSYNDNTIFVTIAPGARIGDPAMVSTEPQAALSAFASDITTGPSDTPPDFAVVRVPGEKFILLRGAIGVGRTPTRLDIAMTAPAETAALSFKQLLDLHGVHISGTTRAHHGQPPYSNAAGDPILPVPSAPTVASSLPANPAVLAEHVSLPLLETIRFTNKMSHNLHAELLLRAVGHERLGVGSTAAGLKVERDFLHAAGVADGDIILNDGSGLARDDLVTPRGMVALLQYAARQPWGGDFRSTLPVAGSDGTLEGRMTGSAASGLIQAKTGEIEHVRALSGYATTLHGQALVFSILYNNNPQHGVGTAAPVDEIANAMVETLGIAPAAKKK
jgi:serine-type D-Ala-D-Ala carboxypeptidase/endopeptidase (penicillin-binding protein 4)